MHSTAILETANSRPYRGEKRDRSGGETGAIISFQSCLVSRVGLSRLEADYWNVHQVGKLTHPDESGVRRIEFPQSSFFVRALPTSEGDTLVLPRFPNDLEHLRDHPMGDLNPESGEHDGGRKRSKLEAPMR